MEEKERKDLEDKILKIWIDNIVPLCDKFDENDRLKAKYQINEKPCVSIRKANNRKPGPRLKVTFDDGTCIEQGVNGITATDILLEVIQRVGIQNIIHNDISASGVDLVQNNLNYASKGLKSLEGFWIVTKTATKEKKVQIDKIKEISQGSIVEIELIE